MGADQHLAMTSGDPHVCLGVLSLSLSLSSLGLALKSQLPVPPWTPAPSSFQKDPASQLGASPCPVAWKLSGGNCRDHLLNFPFIGDQSLFWLMSKVLETSVAHILFYFIFKHLRWKHKSGSCHSPWLESVVFTLGVLGPLLM